MRRALAAAAAAVLLAAGAAAAQEALVATPAEPFLIEGAARTPDGLVLSSVHRARLFRVGAGGALTPFGPEGLQGVFGIAADPGLGVLWAASSPTPHDTETDRPAELLKLDLRTGEVLHRYPGPGGEHAFGDVAVGPDGTVFVADGGTRALLVLRPDAAQLETLVTLPERGSPQGMAVSADGRVLVFSNYGTGLHRIDLSEGWDRRDFTAETLTPIPAPEGAELRGVDGLVRHGDQILAIQNGTRTHRVLRLTLATDWAAVTAVTALVEGLEEPTTGFVEDGALVFVSRSQWTDFDREGQPTSEAPPPAVVSRLPL